MFSNKSHLSVLGDPLEMRRYFMHDFCPFCMFLNRLINNIIISSCELPDSTLIQTFCLHPIETSSGSLSLITASNTKPHIKSPTDGGRQGLSQNGSDSEKSSSGGVGSSNLSISPTQNVRTTKASRLRAAALGK